MRVPEWQILLRDCVFVCVKTTNTGWFTKIRLCFDMDSWAMHFRSSLLFLRDKGNVWEKVSCNLDTMSNMILINSILVFVFCIC